MKNKLKKILLSLFTIIALVILVAGATKASWDDNTTIADNSFTSGNADLDLWDGDSWEDTISTFSDLNIYPGWTKDFTFYIKNNSTANIPLDITVELNSLDGDTDLRENLNLEFIWDGGSVGPQSLSWWKANNWSLGSLNKGIQRTYTARFILLDTAGVELQALSVNFTVFLNGTQAIE